MRQFNALQYFRIAIAVSFKKPPIMELTQKKSIANIAVNAFFLIILNLVMVAIIGYLTLDSEANRNSQFGAMFIGFFMPMFIVFMTPQTKPLERLMKFGTGFILYMISGWIIAGFPTCFVNLLIPSQVVAIATLYYGHHLSGLVDKSYTS